MPGKRKRTAARTSIGRKTHSGPELLQIAMPLGGIGAGCICLNGSGGLMDPQFAGEPMLTADPHAKGPPFGAFALLRVKGARPVTRLVEGPMPPERIYNQGLMGRGYPNIGHVGLPRFDRCRFRGEYPFGMVSLSDPKLPLKVEITGFSPLIPGDDVNSSLPCAILEYTLVNASRKPVEYEFSYHMAHPAMGDPAGRSSRNAVIPGAGVHFHNEQPPGSEAFGSGALVAVGHRPRIKAMWTRGRWNAALWALWREVSEGRFRPNRLTGGDDLAGPNGGSILLSGRLKAGERITYPIVLAWHRPNRHSTHGRADVEALRGGLAPNADPKPLWRPFYAGRWADAKEVARYVRRNYESLRSRTRAFRDALFGSTLPDVVLDAVSANLAILKSPTVLRQENGNLWAWEGCNPSSGCCSGSCTHVWNYAQAIPHLFPALERTFREQELERSMDEAGHAAFRSALPDGPPKHNDHAAADGQLGGILKVYRDWHVSGDRDWLERMYPLAKRSIE